ncbi:MAG TPA: hypothetical protein DEO84_06880 [candidate division Zixibacteria bacterium]|nr:hypothetical protein [candidate division Zixibacteria bacterium]
MIVPQKSKLLLPALAFLLAVLFTLQANAKDTATFKMKTGEEYKNTTFEVNDFYKTVLLKVDGQKINVSFSDIESITDQNGQDVSAKVLGGNYHPQKEQWLSKESTEIQKARAKAWKAIITFGGNYSMPAGDYYDGIDAGIGFGGDLRIAINNQFAIQLIISRSGMKLGNDIHLISYDPNVTILNEDLAIHTTRFEVAFNVFQPFSRINDPRSMFYGMVGLGAARHTTITKATAHNDVTGQTINIDDSHTNSKFAMLFGIGATKMVSKTVGFDFGASMDMIGVGTGSQEYGKNVAYSYIFDLKTSAIVVF